MLIDCRLFNHGKNVIDESVDIFPVAEELFNELDSLGCVERLKTIPHLGDIKAGKMFRKTRFDYMMLQLYLNKLIKNSVGTHQKYTHNAKINSTDFAIEFSFNGYQVTIADIIQCLVICNNIGHFFNTFTSSKAMLLLFDYDYRYFKHFVSSVEDKRFEQLAKVVLARRDYMHLHLLNSLIVLEQCKSESFAVKLSKEIVYSYLERKNISEKLEYTFKLYRTVRDISFVAYDLQTARTPFVLDLCNKEALIALIDEMLNDYNERAFTNSLIISIKNLLSRTLYNDSIYQISSFCNSEIICRAMIKDNEVLKRSIFSYVIMNAASPMNIKYSHKKDFDELGILKITLNRDEMPYTLLNSLRSMNNVRVGVYDRFNEEITILISLKKKCANKSGNALKVFRTVISHLRQSGCTQYDGRYILVTKFLLYYVLERQVFIKPTIEVRNCVVCTRGAKNRIIQLQEIIKNSSSNEDANHEVQAVIDYLLNDVCNDVTITVYGSTQVYDHGKSISEFDGIIIYPNRKIKQLVFIEAKNRKWKKNIAAKELANKFNSLKIQADKEAIITMNHDAYIEMSL